MYCSIGGYMKKSLIGTIAAAFLVLAAVSCEETGGGETPAPVLGLTPKEIPIPAEGGGSSLAFTAPSAWSVSVAASWIHVQPSSGDAGDIVIRITVDPNDTGAPRSTSITVSLTDGTASDQAAVSQAANTAPPEPPAPDPVGGITGDIGGWGDGGNSEFE